MQDKQNEQLSSFVRSRYAHLLKTPEQRLQEVEQNDSLFSDSIDAFQMGVGQGVAGLADFFGMDGVAAQLNDWAESQVSQMSDAGQAALQKRLFGEDSGGLDTWLLTGMQGLGNLTTTIVPGLGAAGGLTRLATMANRGRQLGKTGTAITGGVGFGAVGGSQATGAAEMEIKEVVRSIPFEELSQSPLFREKAKAIRADSPNMAPEEVIALAREAVVAQAELDIKTDPTLLAVNYLSSAIADPIIGRWTGRYVGDKVIDKITGKGTQQGIIKKTVGGMTRAGVRGSKGALAEGFQEALQGDVERRTSTDIVSELKLPPEFEQYLIDTEVNQGMNRGEAALEDFGAGLIPGAVMTARRSRAPLTDNDDINRAASGIDETLDRTQSELDQKAREARERAAEREADDAAADFNSRRFDNLDEPTFARNRNMNAGEAADVIETLTEYDRQRYGEGDIPINRARDGEYLPAGGPEPSDDRFRRGGIKQLEDLENPTQQPLTRRDRLSPPRRADFIATDDRGKQAAQEEADRIRRDQRDRPRLGHSGSIILPDRAPPIQVGSSGLAFGSVQSLQRSRKYRDAVARVGEENVDVVPVGSGYGFRVYETVGPTQQQPQQTVEPQQPAETQPIEAQGPEVERAEPIPVQAMDQPEPPRERGPQSVIEASPTTRVPVSQLKLSKDVPQFKGGADDAGIVEPLQGQFDERGTAPILVWQRTNGDLEVISGRHRFDLAKRSGLETINAQVYKEADGYDRAWAMTMDAELNIRDNQGETEDYASYFRTAGLNEQEAQSRGLLRGAKGRDGFSIARGASDTLYAAYQSGRLSSQAAAALSRAAPQNESLQNLGIDLIANRGRTISATIDQINAVKAIDIDAGRAPDQVDMFGLDDTAMRQAEQLARAASNRRARIQDQIRAAKGAANNPRAAAELGVDVRDPDSVKARLRELELEKDKLENWPTNPELRNELMAEAGLESADARTMREQMEAEQREADERKAQADAQVGDFFLTGSPRPADEAMARGQSDLLVSTRGQAEQNGAVGQTDQDTQSPGESGFLKSDRAATEKPKTSVSTLELDRFVESWLKEYGDAMGVNVQVLRDPGTLAEFGLRKEDTVQGGYVPETGTVYLIASNIPDMKTAKEVLRHEILAHHGLRKAIGREKSKELIRRIIASRNSNNKAMREAWDLIERRYPAESIEVQAEEVFAHLAETETRGLGDAWSRVMAAIKQFLRDIGLMNSGQVSKEELQSVVRSIAKGFRSARNPDGGPDGGIRRQSNEEAIRRRETAAYGPTTAASRVQGSGDVRGSGDLLASAADPETGREEDGSLRGLPRTVRTIDGETITASHFEPAARAARLYMERAGLDYNPPNAYVEADPERGRRIADAYEQMEHAPHDPQVREAYEAMAKETLDQFQAILDETGLEVEFYPTNSKGQVVDPYPGGPREAIEDVRQNNHLYVYPTKDGYGSVDQSGFTAAEMDENPMLRYSGFEFNGEPATVNDVFRAVHDYFGHIKEGVGFRADGEENAWQAHAAMYSPLARRAMTTETRGQNSWLNFGPYGESNRTAKVEDTVFAEQKIGLLPEWVSDENRLGGPDRNGEPEILFSRADTQDTQTIGTLDELPANAELRGARELDRRINADSRKAKDILRDFFTGRTKAGETARQLAYKTLTLRQFAEVAETVQPKIRQYVDAVQSMLTDREVRASRAGKVADDINKWASRAENKQHADDLFDLMHNATLYGIDPANESMSGAEWNKRMMGAHNKLKAQLKAAEADPNPDPVAIGALKNRVNEAKKALVEDYRHRNERSAVLRARWRALPQEARDFYLAMRRIHEDDNATYQQTLIDKIERADIDPARRKRMIDQIRLEQEFAELTGPYFPLGRFGDYVVRFNVNGNEVVYAAESKAEAEEIANNAKAEGATDISFGKRTDKDYKQDGASFQFLEDLMRRINGNEALTEQQRAKLVEDAYQLYLQHLPQRSMRKHRIRRRGVRGFNSDALRSFANVAMKNAYQLSRFTHMDEMNDILKDVVRDADRADPNRDLDTQTKLTDVANELKKRHEWVMNPSNSKVARGLTALGFTYMLGVSPVAALVNLTQTFNVAIPVIKSRSKAGWTSIAAEVVSLGKDFLAESVSNRAVGFDPNNVNSRLSNLEREALTVWSKQGVLDKSNTHNLLGISDTGVEEQFSDTTRKALNAIGWTFHSAEVMNREVTALAAYRALRKDGVSHQDAIKQAADIVWESHFDYTNANRAPFMQGDAAKVLLQFRQYSQQMTYYLWRNFYRALKRGNTTKEQQREAATQLLGTFAVTAGLGGISAMPGIWAVELLANMVQGAFGDEDVPWDAETEARKWLASTLGKDYADLAIFGLGGASVSQRVDLGDLWYRESYRDLDTGEQFWSHLALQVAGPTLGGLGQQFFNGITLMNEGEYYRGLEKMLPKFARDPMVAFRYASEGATNLRGDEIKKADEFTPFDLIMQASGLADTDVVRQYEENNSIKQYEKEILDRRKALIQQFYMAWIDNDERERSEVLRKIRKFNGTHPQLPIDSGSLRSSIRNRIRYTEESNRGVNINRNLRYLATENDWAKD